ncbi:MAG: QueT transporter family protein [Clostridia bacterium]|nr:QueT transporter family protein [Clostridia bacterium]
MKKSFTVREITTAAMIGTVYAVLSIALQPISFGAHQFRVSEALTLLPVLTPAAVPGLVVGCVISNMIGGAGILDVVFGFLATLLAALATRALRGKPVLAALPPVIFNTVIVGTVLSCVGSLPLLWTMLDVGIGELGGCFILGLPLLWALKRAKLFEKTASGQ